MTRGVARKGFDIDLRDGQYVEDTILRVLLDKRLIEVKYQPEARTHLFIEIQSRGRPSGLATTEAEWWAIVYDGGDMILWIRTEKLRELVTLWSTSRGGDFDTSVGYAIPIAVLARP